MSLIGQGPAGNVKQMALYPLGFLFRINLFNEIPRGHLEIRQLNTLHKTQSSSNDSKLILMNAVIKKDTTQYGFNNGLSTLKQNGR